MVLAPHLCLPVLYFMELLTFADTLLDTSCYTGGPLCSYIIACFTLCRLICLCHCVTVYCLCYNVLACYQSCSSGRQTVSRCVTRRSKCAPMDLPLIFSCITVSKILLVLQYMLAVMVQSGSRLFHSVLQRDHNAPLHPFCAPVLLFNIQTVLLVLPVMVQTV